MCGGGGGGPDTLPGGPTGELPELSAEQLNSAVSLPSGFTAKPVLGEPGTDAPPSYAIYDPSGDVYSASSDFGQFLSAANEVNSFAGAANSIYNPETNSFVNSTTGQNLSIEGLSAAPQLSKTGVIGGREVGVAGPGDDIPGVTELAYGLAAEGLTLPEQQLAGFTPDQLNAFEMARAGIGSYQPYLDRATDLTDTGVAALQRAMRQTNRLARQIPGEVQSGQAALSQAALDVQRFAGEGARSADEAAANVLLMESSSRIGDLAARTEERLLSQGIKAEDIAAQAAANARALQDPMAAQLGQSTSGARGFAQQGIAGAQTAADRARMSTAEAQQSLAEAAQMGRSTAQQGIAQLAGTGQMFDPSMTGSFMNQYEDAAVQATLDDMARQGLMQQNEAAAQAIQSEAFGGSRDALVRSELARNLLEQQGKVSSQMRAAGAESAAQRAQQAFEAAQGRQQNVAQLTGQLGQIGVGASAQAAQAGGQLGLSAEELAQSGALQSAQLGMSGEQFAAANAQAVAQTGLSIEQLAAQTGLSAAEVAGTFAMQAGQFGLSAEQQRQNAALQQAQLAQQQAQLGMSGAESAGNLGMAGAQMQMSGAGQAGNLGLQGSNLGLAGISAGLGAQQQYAGLGQGIAGLGQQYYGLGQGAQQMGLQDVNTMLGIGATQQRQDQAYYDTLYGNQYRQMMQPYQQLAFLSDIVTGAPSGQAATMSQPGPSVGSQLVGGATALYGLDQAGLNPFR
jgi:AraC-like DNA-binding protein